MKLTDLMLDFATGDASGHDVTIEYDKGRIDVSAVVFEACVKTADMLDSYDDDDAFIQEAADAGLPTDKMGAVAQASAAANTSVEAYYDLVVDTAKKLKESLTKDWKAIVGIAKKMGISVSDATGEDFGTKFAMPLATKITGGKSLKLSEKAFVTANFARNYTSDYCNGIAKILSAYGISMSYDCPVTKNFVGDLAKSAPCADNSDSCVQQAAQAINHGSKMIKGEGAFSKTANVTAKDFATYVTAVYVLKGFTETVVKRAGSASTRKTAINKLNSIMNDTNKKGVSHASKNIVKVTSERAANLQEAADQGSKAFTDAIYAVTEAMSGGNMLPAQQK